jgi:hypothetical protein
MMFSGKEKARRAGRALLIGSLGSDFVGFLVVLPLEERR